MSPDIPATPLGPPGPGRDVPDLTRAGRSDDDADLLAALADWLPTQRWFAGKGADAARTTLLSRNPVGVAADGIAVDLVLVGADTATGRAIYQMLVGWRTDPPEQVGHAIIGTVGERICYDALHDHAVTDRLLAALAAGEQWGALTAVREPDADLDPSAHGLVITAEQSNTSIVYGDSMILKVFRRLDPGVNPDVEVHRALHAVGCQHIADPLGELVGLVEGVPTTLGLATRYFANCADGWAMATASVRDLMAEGDLHAGEVGGDFAAEAHRLGEAVAAVHRDLAQALGTNTMSDGRVRALLDGMAAHAERLAARVPALAEHLDAIRSRYAAAADALTGSRIDVQRVHGDLHLGQALRTLHGWVLIDFEGEPSRPLATRRAMHSPLQDVAGMLRSFDYAAHQPFMAGASDTQHAYRAAEWSERNRAAFCDGYAAVAGSDPREESALLRAFELGKAVYEVGYEHGHRPAWEQIPLAAVAELITPD